MENNIIRSCPSPLNFTTQFDTWKYNEAVKVANNWAELSNAGKDKFEEPTWSWDCQYKLDFDGPIVHVESRFYYNYETDDWDGNISIMKKDKELKEIKIKANNLDELKEKVEKAVQEWIDKCLKITIEQ